MKLSIITVNLNNRDGLQKTIDSVICQTFRDFEWIVIDGGSTDGSKELIEQYADHFAYWVSEPDKGIYNAMNKGIRVARGEYLQFLNSGDWLVDRSALERCFGHVFEADIVYGEIDFCFEDRGEKSDYPDKLDFRFLYKGSLGHNASFIKRDLFQDELYDEELKIVSDWKFFLIQALKNKGFQHIDETVSCFNTNGISSANRDLVNHERKTVIGQLIPESIIADYKLMDEMEATLSNDHVNKVLEYGNKKRLYHKLITTCLLFIRLLDNLHGKKKSINHNTLL